MSNRKIRPPAVAGAFYPGGTAQLRAAVETYLDAATPPDLHDVHAVIAPHAGYMYSGPIAGFSYKLLQQQPQAPQRIFLLGPSHRVWFPGVALADYDAFRTPLGEVPVDRAGLQALADADTTFQPFAEAHRYEHSLEVQLPFLQLLYPGTPILPLLYGNVDPVTVGKYLEPHLTPQDLIVVSSDLSHYLSYDQAQQRDHAFIAALLHGQQQKMARDAACGLVPILTLMTIAEQRNWTPHLLDYRSSGDTAGDQDRVVGYAAIAYVGG